MTGAMNVAAFDYLTKRKDNAANAGMDQTEKVCAVLDSAVVLCLN
jgi:hypothetical protein